MEGVHITAVIVCNGIIEDYTYYRKYLEKAQLLVCADGGAAHLRRMGVKPDVLLGDLDSISEEDLEHFKDAGVKIEKFPAEKDMTDTELAVQYAIDRGCDTIIIIGGVGTRLDHSLANILSLKKIMDRNVRGFVVDEHNEITIIRDSIKLFREEGVKVTLLPLTEKVEGVTTKGLYYPLVDATMEMGTSWGVSNEFSCEEAEISIKSGLLLIIRSRD